MVIQIFNNLFQLDTRTLTGVLLWGNIAGAFLVYTFHTLNIKTIDKKYMHHLLRLRLSYCIGYLLFCFRGIINDYLSVNLGNTILFICFYYESTLFLSVFKDYSKKMKTILNTILGSSLFIFNLVELIFNDASIRVTMASVIILFILIIPTFKFIFSKNISRFKHGIGVFYAIILISLIPRILISGSDKNTYLLSNSYHQTLFFLSLIMMMIAGTTVHLLFMKENSDDIIYSMAMIDSLTNLSNRYSFIEAANNFFEQHKKETKPFTTIFLDVDNFKTVNDTYGHLFGDNILKHLAFVISKNLRSCDLSCRYGGDEFLICLANSDERIGRKVAERIMEEVSRAVFEQNPDFSYMISMGIRQGIPKNRETIEQYIEQADQALYKAKNAGRNRIVKYERQ